MADGQGRRVWCIQALTSVWEKLQSNHQKRGYMMDIHDQVMRQTLYPPALFSATCSHAVGLTSHRLWRALGTWPCHQRKGRRPAKTLELSQLGFLWNLGNSSCTRSLPMAVFTTSGLYPFRHMDDFFAYWEKPIYLLRPSVEDYRNPQALLTGNIVNMPVIESEMRRAQH